MRRVAPLFSTAESSIFPSEWFGATRGKQKSGSVGFHFLCFVSSAKKKDLNIYAMDQWSSTSRKGQTKEQVRGSLEKTLNELPEAEKLTQALRYVRNEIH